jgi:NAD(P)-dependent dehydrogenase (short-subunit alcohol dehydrogenase family)
MTQFATFHDLKDASVFITGGGAGIGAALTEAFIAQGAQVAFVQRSDASRFVAEVEQRHGRAPVFIPCDLTDIDALKGAIAQAAAAHGPVTVLLSNAANDNRHTTEQLSVADWDANMAVNLRHYFFAAQAVLPGMIAAKGGSIINLSSTSYMLGLGDYPAYVTANAGIMGMTRGHAREFGPYGIRVNAVMPGWVMTERQQRLWVTEEKLAGHLGRQCIKEAMQPEDLTGGVLYLASAASKMLTGQAIVIDGGTVVTG